QYVADVGAWRQRHVGLATDGEAFAFTLGGAVDPAMRPDLAGLPAAADGTLLERCPDAERLVAALAARLVAGGGAALIIDYGPARSGPGETLQAVRDHRPADPLADPGEIDLSHHVDFERLANAAAEAGARPWGPIPQGLFLGRLGIAERAAALSAAAPDDGAAIEGAIRRLVHPGRMGLLFKALAVSHPALPAPPGFIAGG
ncbi:MAG TPA: SAM-dependent methyltransferase, partial [Rhodospirillales bacterium]|nr:SAM-dependent methyltransferase [Rhodospirillales bacterium]